MMRALITLCTLATIPAGAMAEQTMVCKTFSDTPVDGSFRETGRTIITKADNGDVTLSSTVSVPGDAGLESMDTPMPVLFANTSDAGAQKDRFTTIISTIQNTAGDHALPVTLVIDWVEPSRQVMVLFEPQRPDFMPDWRTMMSGPVTCEIVQ